jgi:tRNA threonylcarbamoyladenosine dehydratase
MSASYLDRFSGIARLYGHAALENFYQANIAVIGIGGVGSWAAEALARSGIGMLTLIDLDDICISNTNRQIHTLTNTIGSLKTATMGERILAINPECRVNSVASFVTAKSAPQLLTRDYDYVIDAIDVVRHKAAIIAHCQREKISLITTGGAGGLTDPTQICTTDLSRTFHDPLLAKVRKQLRQQYNFSSNPKRRFGIEAVFSVEQQVYPDKDGGVCQRKPPPGESTRLDCATGFGAATAITASFGFVAAARVLSKLATSRRIGRA